MRAGRDDILGVAAIIEPSHAAHERDDDAPHWERGISRFIDDTNALGPQHAWKADLWVFPPACVDLGAAESNRFDADTDPSRWRLRKRRLLDLERLWTTRKA